MDFSNLNYFCTVAKHGNLSRAAQELYVSQPGLSRYLSRLEEEIGVPLFDRRRGKVVLNTYGQLFLSSVNLAFDQLESGVDTVRQLYSRDQNILSVACSIDDFLIDRLKDFSNLHPEVGIRQFSYSMAEIETQLLRQNLDFAICAYAIENSQICYERLDSCPYIVLCHEDNPLTGHKDGIMLSEAMNQHFICESSRLDRRHLEALCRRAGFTPRISHEVENGYILANLLENGTGIALVPSAYYIKLNMQLPNHSLRVVRVLDEDLPEAEIGVAYLARRKWSASATQFLTHLREWAQTEAERLQSSGLKP